MCHESSHRSAAGVLAAVPAGPPRPLGAGAAFLGRVVAERLLDELVLVDGTSAPAAPQSPLLGVDGRTKMVEALLRDLGREVSEASASGQKLVALDYALKSGIWVSNDWGATWAKAAGQPEPTSQIDWRGVASSADGMKLVAVADYGDIWLSPDAGASWTKKELESRHHRWLDVASSADGARLVAVTGTGFSKCADAD